MWFGVVVVRSQNLENEHFLFPTHWFVSYSKFWLTTGWLYQQELGVSVGAMMNLCAVLEHDGTMKFLLSNSWIKRIIHRNIQQGRSWQNMIIIVHRKRLGSELLMEAVLSFFSFVVNADTKCAFRPIDDSRNKSRNSFFPLVLLGSCV
jgi:hypothetical protein